MTYKEDMASQILPVETNNRKIFPFKNKQEFLEVIKQYNGILIAIGAEKLLNPDPELISIINRNVAYCDGFGAVYALKRKGAEAAKIPGAYFWLDVVKEFYKTKTFYLIGAKKEVLVKTIKKLEKEFPDVKIVGSQDGYFRDEQAVLDDILFKKPDIVFVAMGSPKQEFLMDRFQNKYKALYMGLGGSFDLYSGKAKPVPEWWNKIFKWEGLYRLLGDITNVQRLKRQKIVLKYFSYVIKGKI